MVFANPPTRQATRVNLSQHQGATPQPPDGDLAGASPPGPLARSAPGSVRSCQTPRIRAGGPSISGQLRRGRSAAVSATILRRRLPCRPTHAVPGALRRPRPLRSPGVHGFIMSSRRTGASHGELTMRSGGSPPSHDEAGRPWAGAAPRGSEPRQPALGGHPPHGPGVARRPLRTAFARPRPRVARPPTAGHPKDRRTGEQRPK